MTPFHKTQQQTLRLFRANPRLAQSHLYSLINAAKREHRSTADLEALAVDLIAKQLKRECRQERRAS